MRISALLLFIFSAVTGAIQAQTFSFDSVGYKYISIGTVTLKGDTWIIREGDGKFTHDYYPINLDETLKKEGQEVAFEGALGKIPANVRMSATPIQLYVCRRLYRTQPNEDGSEMEVNNQKQETTQQEAPLFLENRKGKIMQIGGTWIIEMEGGKRFVPDYMPEDFKVEGLEIIFSGNAGTNPPNVKVLGDPLSITAMQAVEEQAINPEDIQEPMRDYYPFEITSVVSRQEGIIKKFSDDPDVYIIEAENGTRRYLPAVIPAAFKQHNLRVYFSGNAGSVPPNVRMIGTPFELETIELME